MSLDAERGTLEVADAAELHRREPTGRAPQGEAFAGTGRELFAAFRATVDPADRGASVFPGAALEQTHRRQEADVVEPA